MATYRPLIVNAAANQIQEISGSDTLDSLDLLEQQFLLLAKCQ